MQKFLQREDEGKVIASRNLIRRAAVLHGTAVGVYPSHKEKEKLKEEVFCLSLSLLVRPLMTILKEIGFRNVQILLNW